jgi:hypothetical protein
MHYLKNTDKKIQIFNQNEKKEPLGAMTLLAQFWSFSRLFSTWGQAE